MLEKTLLRGSSGSASYCSHSLCPDMGEASSIVSNLETLPTSSSHRKGKEELDTTSPNTTADGAAHGLSLDRVREETLYKL